MESVLPLVGLHDALALLANDRDPHAWAYVVERTGAEIERLASRLTGDPHLAQDVVQETLLQIRDHAAKFRQPADSADLAARRWILGITANVSANLLRKRRRDHRRRVALTERPSMEDPTEEPPDHDAIRSALAELPRHQRQAISLHHVAGLEFAEVANELGCPVGTAKTNVRRGLKRLRRSLLRVGISASGLTIAEILTRLPAAETSADRAAAHALLTAPLHATKLTVTSTTGGFIMASKIGVIAASMLFAVGSPFLFSQDDGNDSQPVPLPPAVDNGRTDYMRVNEAHAAKRLRNVIFPAEVRFKADAYRDADDDYVGEYAFMSELWGAGLLSANPEDPSVCYQYAIYLPGADNLPMREVPGATNREKVAPSVIQLQEQHFVAYAWPDNATVGSLMFMLTEDGQVRSHPYAGKPPHWADGFDGNTSFASGSPFAASSSWTVVPLVSGIKLHHIEFREILEVYEHVELGHVSAPVEANADGTFSFAPSSWHQNDDTVVAKKTPHGQLPTTFYRVGEAVLTGDDVINAYGMPVEGKKALGIKFTAQGADRVRAFTQAVIDKGPRSVSPAMKTIHPKLSTGRIAVLVDQRVVSDPEIITAITEDEMIITGEWSDEEIAELITPQVVLAN
jgi:RNA polymerase sigma-70 factor, ECF subfamily